MNFQQPNPYYSRPTMQQPTPVPYNVQQYPSSTNKIKQQIRSDENYVPFYPNTFQSSFSPYSTPAPT
ncbi:unnamed protein product, partial [Rotaria magnacalcarata]